MKLPRSSSSFHFRSSLSSRRDGASVSSSRRRPAESPDPLLPESETNAPFIGPLPAPPVSRGQRGPSLWNGAFFAEQLREPKTPNIKGVAPPTFSSTPSGSVNRLGTKRGSSDSSPVSSAGSLDRDGKQPETSPTSVSTSRESRFIGPLPSYSSSSPTSFLKRRSNVRHGPLMEDGRFFSKRPDDYSNTRWGDISDPEVAKVLLKEHFQDTSCTVPLPLSHWQQVHTPLSLSSSRSLMIEKTDAERVKAVFSNPVKPSEFIAAGVPMRFESSHSNSRLKGMKKNGKGK